MRGLISTIVPVILGCILIFESSCSGSEELEAQMMLNDSIVEIEQVRLVERYSFDSVLISSNLYFSSENYEIGPDARTPDSSIYSDGAWVLAFQTMEKPEESEYSGTYHHKLEDISENFRDYTFLNSYYNFYCDEHRQRIGPFANQAGLSIEESDGCFRIDFEFAYYSEATSGTGNVYTISGRFEGRPELIREFP